MKKVLLIFILCISELILLGQQPFFSPDTTFERQSLDFRFEAVVIVDTSLTKDKLYQHVKQWFSESFVSSKNVIDNADKDEGVIYGHVVIPMDNSTYGHVKFNIEVRCKDGKIKYLLDDFSHKDAQVVNVYGYAPNPSAVFSLGSLSQIDVPENLTYNNTGRSPKRRKAMWQEVKFKSKKTAYFLY